MLQFKEEVKNAKLIVLILSFGYYPYRLKMDYFIFFPTIK